MKKILMFVWVLFVVLLVNGHFVSAVSAGTFFVNNAYAKSDVKYDVVVHDPTKESLKLYVNDNYAIGAKVNNHGWATFQRVKLSGQQKLSFAHSVKSVYVPLNYVKYVDVSGGRVTLYDSPFESAQVSTNQLAARTKTSNCRVTPNREQDAACTPGAIFTDVTKSMICKSGYSKSVRNVSNEVKSQVYAEYGITTHTSGQYEVDHLIPLELGGSNDIANLWPEAALPTPGFHEKDAVENYLHSQVCSGKMSLTEAQQKEANSWVQVYIGMFPSPPAVKPAPAPAPVKAPTPAPVAPIASPAPVTTGVVKKSSTGICHAPGTTYYNRTTNFTPFSTIDSCLASGGRLPLR